MSEPSSRFLQLIVCLMLLPAFGEAQTRPTLTGEWELVEALASGPGRGSPDGAFEQPRRTTSTTISGAPFNCGRGCTILHKGETLTIANAQLSSGGGTGSSEPAPSVTIPLHGQQARVVDSFNAPNELLMTARWEGGKVQIDRESGPLAIRQILSIENGQLLVVSSAVLDGESRGNTTFRYRKK